MSVTVATVPRVWVQVIVSVYALLEVNGEGLMGSLCPVPSKRRPSGSDITVSLGKNKRRMGVTFAEEL